VNVSGQLVIVGYVISRPLYIQIIDPIIFTIVSTDTIAFNVSAIGPTSFQMLFFPLIYRVGPRVGYLWVLSGSLPDVQIKKFDDYATPRFAPGYQTSNLLMQAALMSWLNRDTLSFESLYKSV